MKNWHPGSMLVGVSVFILATALVNNLLKVLITASFFALFIFIYPPRKEFLRLVRKVGLVSVLPIFALIVLFKENLYVYTWIRIGLATGWALLFLSSYYPEEIALGLEWLVKSISRGKFKVKRITETLLLAENVVKRFKMVKNPKEIPDVIADVVKDKSPISTRKKEPNGKHPWIGLLLSGINLTLNIIL